MDRKGRIDREIEHGSWLDANDPEELWGWSNVAGRIRAQRRATLVGEYAQLGPGIRALELGCGSGLFTEMFAETGAQISALDVSPNLLARARERCFREKNVKFVLSSFEEYDVEEKYDAIIGSSVLHHLDLATALPAIYDLLKAGGRACFAEPNYLNPQVFLERKLRNVLSVFNYVSEDEIAFLRWSLKRYIEGYAFENVVIRPFDWVHPSIPNKMACLAQKVGYVIEKISIIKEFSGSLHICFEKPL